MTRKDYVLLAAALASVKPAPRQPYQEAQYIKDCQAIADALARNNSAFDMARFMAACGVQHHE